MNETHEAWQGLGTPAGPQIGWAAPQPPPGPVRVPHHCSRRRSPRHPCRADPGRASRR